jgi:hypothetical protein
MPSLPYNDGKNITAPHVVILGAGASKASFPKGEASGLEVPLMNDIIRVLGISDIFRCHGIGINNNDFESIYDQLVTDRKNINLINKIEKKVYTYFNCLNLPESTTIYDYLVLSLRETDIIATLNWDPFLAQAYKRNCHVGNMPQIVFLHGNVGIGLCENYKMIGFIDQLCNKCGQPLKPSKLLYPVKHKRYNEDIFIKDQWDRLRDKLQTAYFITIFGYRAPNTDIEAKQLMIEVWNNNPTKDYAQIEIINTQAKKELKETWKDFMVRQHYWIHGDIFNSYLFTHPRRSCDAFFYATLRNKPWKDNPLPKFDTLDELHHWIKPLILEEERYKSNGERFKSIVCPPIVKEF